VKYNDKLKILYVVISLFPGGLENGLVNLINNFPSEYNQVVCCLMKKGAFAARLKKECKVIELNMPPGNDYLMPLRILRLIRDEKINVVRTFTEDPLFYSILPAMITQTPIIHYNGGRIFPEKKKKVLLERLLSNLTDAVVVPSRDLADYMIKTVGIREKKIRVIPNGIDIERFSILTDVDRKKRELGIPKNDLVVGTIGRLERQKDYPTFLEIAEIVLSKRKSATFLIAGDGKLKEDMLVLSRRKGIEGKVKFLGVRDDVAELYQVMDLFVLTSRWEGMSNVLLEAMASKRTVLATRVEGMSGLIEHGTNGYLFNVGDVAGFSDAILTLTSEQREKIGENACAKVCRKYNMMTMVKNYEDLYIEVLGKKKDSFSRSYF
jgi:glycosyltransferase involved in cell wall biosynthesis